MVPMAVTIYGVCALSFMMASYSLERQGCEEVTPGRGICRGTDTQAGRRVISSMTLSFRISRRSPWLKSFSSLT